MNNGRVDWVRLTGRRPSCGLSSPLCHPIPCQKWPRKGLQPFSHCNVSQPEYSIGELDRSYFNGAPDIKVDAVGGRNAWKMNVNGTEHTIFQTQPQTLTLK